MSIHFQRCTNGLYDSCSGTGTFYHKDSHFSDEDIDDTIRIREISFMSMYPEDDDGECLGTDEFGNLRKSVSRAFRENLPDED